MTAMTVASAPGKVVLCGEYAVLDGAPAICMAIDRRAVVRVSASHGTTHRVIAPGYSRTDGVFRSNADGIEWLQGQFAIVDAVWCAANVRRDDACTIVLDTREFIDAPTQSKLGIGSSAALTVALTLALGTAERLPGDARRAHAALQAGAGSGVDIACSISGGLIEYLAEGARVTSLRWPDTLVFRLIWSGVAASTGAKLAILKTGNTKPSRAALLSAATTMAAAWRSGIAGNVMASYHDYIAALRSFSVDYDLGVFDAGHGPLVDAAADAGLVYKPCGAGGGDVGILLGTDESRLDAFMSDELGAAFSFIECGLDHGGARIEDS